MVGLLDTFRDSFCKFCSSQRFSNAVFCLVSLCLLGVSFNTSNTFNLANVQKCLLDAIHEIPLSVTKELKQVKKRSSMDEKMDLCLNFYTRNAVLETHNRSIFISSLFRQKLVHFFDLCVLNKQNKSACSYTRASSKAPPNCYIYSNVSNFAHYCFDNRTTFSALWIANTSVAAVQARLLLQHLAI